MADQRSPETDGAVDRNDFWILAERFSTTLGGSSFARIGLDERQEVANRLYKTVTLNITSQFVSTLLVFVGLREKALEEVTEHLLLDEKVRDPRRNFPAKEWRKFK